MVYKIVNEGIEHKELVGLVKPELHVDEFASKMGDDDDIVVLSFYVRDADAAKDLANWFEKGYTWILDADISPGEIAPGRYLVYVELPRRTSVFPRINQLLTDLSTLTEFNDPSEWTVEYRDHVFNFSIEQAESVIPNSPAAYREQEETRLNEIRTVAGIPEVQVYNSKDPAIQQLKAAAGF